MQVTDKPAYININTAEKLYWRDIFSFVKEQKEYKVVCDSNDYSVVFLHLISSLIYDQEIIFIDPSISDDEIADIYSNASLKYPTTDIIIPQSIQEFEEKLKHIKNWKITLFTSGTTGRPKKVVHSFASITRNIKKNDARKNDVWALAYSLKHMSGIQVFFQAMMNFNPLIVVFGADRAKILSSIQEYQITHLSATSTFYRLLNPIEKPIYNVKNISFGGEKTNASLIELLSVGFPNARFRNIYASTEAGALFAGEGEYFKLNNDIKDKVKIIENEIYIHKSVLGNLDEKLLENDWYKTGDLVEFKDEEKVYFQFVARKNELINVGGYKVNPNEIEILLNNHPGIKQSRVFGKKNSITGNLIVAEIVKLDENLLEKDIRKYLEGKLQDYKIPRIISFVPEIKTTSTGKITRLK